MRVKVASQSASHNWVIDNKDQDLSSGTTSTHLASRGSCGKSSLATCVECTMEPFGLWMVIGCIAGHRLLIGNVVVKKWPVAPVSAQVSMKFVEERVVGAPDK